MSYIYEPEIEEEDAGYSIPKILVAVLIFILIGAGAYIYLQQKKLKTSVSYLLDAKKQVELDLNQMIEKYNLAIDDNSLLEDDLKDERDFIIRYRDSIRGMKSEDFKEIANFKKTISELKQVSAIQFENLSTSNESLEKTDETKTIVEEKSTNTSTGINTKKTNNNSSTQKTIKSAETLDTLNNEISSLEKEEFSETVEKLIEDGEKPKEVKLKTTEKKVTSTTFNRVEIPPTYPGCKGSPSEKKACFAKKVKKHLSRKFDANIVDNLDLSSGQKRMWVHFNVDKFGNIVNIRASGPHQDLEREAVRIMSKLPKMVAAKQNGHSVQISYSVPITFKIP